jgi:hypothetical protein
MVSLLAVLAALFGLALAAYIVLYLPAWAAFCVVLGAVVITLGGGALLAKALVLCALVAMAARFMRRRER